MEGSIHIGMKLQNAPADLPINGIEIDKGDDEKKIRLTSAEQGAKVNVKVPYHEVFTVMFKQIVEFI